MTNALMFIEPYWHEGTWVFDDQSRGLDKEPFVAGIPEMISDLVQDIPDARRGFRLIFSSLPFPSYQIELTRVREDYEGNWYRLKDGPGEGWLCPALYKYFETAPESIYVRAEPSHQAVQDRLSEVAALKNRIEDLERLVYSLTMENEFLKSGNNPPSFSESWGNPEL